MKKIISLILAVAMMLGALALFTGCATKHPGATINVYLGNSVYDFDPTDYYADSNADQLMSLLFEPLFSVNDDGKLEKAAAKKYEVDYETRTIVIDIRETYWSDDTRVCAADFVYAIRDRILNPANPNPAAALFYDIENAAAAKSGNVSISDIGIVASENYQLTITYREGADVDQLLKNLASVAASPVKSATVESAPTYWSKTVNTMVFNGPFKIKTFDNTTGEMTLTRNLGYHQDPTVKDYDNKVRPNQLIATFTVGGEPVAVSYADLENKTVFYMTDASVEDRANHGGSTYDDTSVYAYVFNTTNPLFADARVRKALSMAIDREAIVNAVKLGKAANGFIPDFMGGSSEALINTTADLEGARALLAGVDFTGISKSFTLTVNNDEESKIIAELVVAAWNSLGFNVTVKYAGVKNAVVQEIQITDSEIQWLVKEASYGNYKFDVLAVDWQLYSTDPFVGLSAFSTSLGGGGYDVAGSTNRLNIAGWQSASYDSLINGAFKNMGDTRAEYLKDAEALLCEAAPVCPILFNQTVSYASSEIKKVTVDGYGNIVFTDMKLKNYEDYLPEE